MGKDWGQTMVVLLAVAASSVGVSLWVQSLVHPLGMKVLALELTITGDRKAVKARLGAEGWSYSEQNRWIEELRLNAEHAVPSASRIKHPD